MHERSTSAPPFTSVRRRWRVAFLPKYRNAFSKMETSFDEDKHPRHISYLPCCPGVPQINVYRYHTWLYHTVSYSKKKHKPDRQRKLRHPAHQRGRGGVRNKLRSSASLSQPPEQKKKTPTTSSNNPFRAATHTRGKITWNQRRTFFCSGN